MDAPGSTDAAVLVPLYETAGELHAVFTKRRDDLRRHAGEISFPGGRQDFPDEDLRVTALREAEEEIGLAREAVDLVGALAPVGTFVTGYRVFPFVGVIEPGTRWTLQEREVDEVLELSLASLVDGFEMQRLLRKGVPIKTPTFTVG
jgi:8-oxo-dGTP pyrophosphatase MutT (NUDIX family)